ncbi:hypothetical protein SLOPH_846 [Spraguea lophii 42_110]|uniref:Uncharacterized protein n=1 Tax=Spraguea lophii (strain 42_110) TaxID=1358809 RepID=S7W8Q2_SPRLO|nr:hypothetical protein SLOPH_846 [Spraguea lophii 42_110]
MSLRRKNKIKNKKSIFDDLESEIPLPSKYSYTDSITHFYTLHPHTELLTIKNFLENNTYDIDSDSSSNMEEISNDKCDSETEEIDISHSKVSKYIDIAAEDEEISEDIHIKEQHKDYYIEDSNYSNLPSSIPKISLKEPLITLNESDYDYTDSEEIESDDSISYSDSDIINNNIKIEESIQEAKEETNNCNIEYSNEEDLFKF